MLGFSLYLSFLLLPQFFAISSAVLPNYTPTDNILLNCGASFKTNSSDGRQWNTDSPYSSNTSTTSSTQSEPPPSVDQIPYSTARVFPSKFTYKIPVSGAGQKFLRLYFYPTTYSQSLDMNNSFFSVHTANHSLLSNFSVSLNLQKDFVTLVKEYIITVDESRSLEVTFTPNPKSFAFVNGIEVVSIPDKLYSGVIKLLGNYNGYPIDDSIALENLYRLNVGETGDISSTDDTGMFRSWDRDEPYLLGGTLGLTPTLKIPIKYTSDTPPYTAPEIVYYSARSMNLESYGSNLTWAFPVDSGFYYLLRLHFCELVMLINGPHLRVFNIFINNQTAEKHADVFYWTGGRGIPVYKDYVAYVSDNLDGSNSKTDLWLALHPSIDDPVCQNAILNGLEIFKLSKGDTLAAPNPESLEPALPPETVKSRHVQKRGPIVSICIIGGSLGGVILFSLILVGFLLHKRRTPRSQDIDHKSRSTTNNISSFPSVRSKKFSLEEIKLATGNFDDNFIIGRGGFGNVYKGYLENGVYTVAIKRLNPSSRQGFHEFQTEIKMLSNLRHLHLVPLIGYSNDGGEMILVYDYMAQGTLSSHLYGKNNHQLSWKQRLQICIGAAKGLHYLHSGIERMIIHRDVKSTNILLDENMVAKVSDFGLSRVGPRDPTVTHISTIVKGSFGYLDPEYYKRKQITCKSDVYSFGVVLFEVLCARPAIMPDLPMEQVNLAYWARNCYREGNLVEIVDKNLIGEIAVESLNKFGEVGYSCLREQGTDRPSMSDVVWNLEFALQLQESSEMLDKNVHSNLRDHQNVHLLSDAKDYIAKIYHKLFSSTATVTSSAKSGGFKSGIGSVFSEIFNLKAR
ncbi:hypothetical protein DCAR_0729222 [Daucus carota subsp. sativus]|uniref:Protein kinase domain-containing protein n=1 Tax=Daucus carota subsp. sativus TaxID=79200 RepID=A0AAF0XKL1_DAUCS|nr:PREDICTED: receptor-like protein kinase FERONIA [Daucus carota subsp. sativus]WOH09763.1 hypothetical protein DCAR_0729222 [Daucus carota subsp. sativus]